MTFIINSTHTGKKYSPGQTTSWVPKPTATLKINDQIIEIIHRTFFKTNDRDQTSDLRNSENTNQDKLNKNKYASQLLETKGGKEIEGGPKGDRHVTYRGSRMRITSDFSSDAGQAEDSGRDIDRVPNVKNLPTQIYFRPVGRIVNKVLVL